MRLTLGKFRFLPLALAIAAGGLSIPSTSAQERQTDRVYADSFGNLVVLSRAGYKRIVVGAGHLAKELSDYQGGQDDDVLYYNEDRYGYDDPVLRGDCWRPAILLKGRSYMYGLEDGELPDLPGKCR